MVSSPSNNASKIDSYGDMSASSPVPGQTSSPYAAGGPVAQRVEADQNGQMNAWSGEMSVRHVGGDGGGMATPPSLPYAEGRSGRNSSESRGRGALEGTGGAGEQSPSRSMRKEAWDKQRALGMA